MAHAKFDLDQKNVMSKSIFPPQHSPIIASKRNKGILVLSTGLGGTGQTTHLKEVARSIPNCVLIEKDILNESYLGEHKMQSKYYNEHVKMQTYIAMINLACSLMALGKIVIIDGGVGGKLLTFFKKYLNSQEFDTKVIYFHCSGITQYERIIYRNADRDADKIGSKFDSYRQEHLAQHLRELKQLTHFLLIDTENPNQVLQNVERIVKYINQSSSTVSILATDVPMPKLDIEDAKKGVKEIKALLDAVKYFQALIKKEAMNYLATLKYDGKMGAFNKLCNVKEKSEFIWKQIKANVAVIVFKELKGFYSRRDNPNFVDFINLGFDILLTNLDCYLQLPWYVSKATQMLNFGSRLHSGNVRLWSLGSNYVNEKMEDVHPNNVYRP